MGYFIKRQHNLLIEYCILTCGYLSFSWTSYLVIEKVKEVEARTIELSGTLFCITHDIRFKVWILFFLHENKHNVKLINQTKASLKDKYWSLKELWIIINFLVILILLAYCFHNPICNPVCLILLRFVQIRHLHHCQFPFRLIELWKSP